MTSASPRLAQLARRNAVTSLESANALSSEQRCELCGEVLLADHRHVADVQARSLLCACRSCAVLLSRPGAGGGHFRLVPERRLVLGSFELDEERWSALQIPVGLAFFFYSTPAARVVAVYPSALGATESRLPLDAWADLERENPVLRELEPDVEALLVNRARGAREHLLVPIDDCYALVALVRSCWKGLAGGDELWEETDRFFARLRERAGAYEAGKEVG